MLTACILHANCIKKMCSIQERVRSACWQLFYIAILPPHAKKLIKMLLCLQKMQYRRGEESMMLPQIIIG